MSPFRKDDEYYLTDVVFLVEDRLFKVPRRNFEAGSELFGGMFGVPQSSESIVDGSNDEHPLRLDGYKAQDFQRFLRVLYPVTIGLYDLETVDEWASVLRLAHIWGFAAVRTLAIEKISLLSVEPTLKVVLAKDFSVGQWLLPALNLLAQRPEPIGPADVELLGLDWALKLAAVREMDRRLVRVVASPYQSALQNAVHGPPVLRCGSCGMDSASAKTSICKRSEYDFTQHIYAVFGEELKP